MVNTLSLQETLKKLSFGGLTGYIYAIVVLKFNPFPKTVGKMLLTIFQYGYTSYL